MNVLIADDDSIIRLLLRAALVQHGHIVTETETGAEALAAWQKDRHPLVISDWMMPDLDGLELCRQIRAEPSAQLTYVILLTARAGKANYLEAMEAGVDDFVVKPFQKDEFAAHLRVASRILGLHENLQQMNLQLEQRVTERTAQLESALRVKSEFLSRASHELRTPMNHILGFAQLLQLDPLDAEQERHVDQILNSGQRLLKLIDQLLAVSKSASGDLNSFEIGYAPSGDNTGQRTR